MGINTAYHIDFPTVKLLLYILSSTRIRDCLRCGLDDVKAKDDDIYNTNNYLQTFRDLLNITRIQIDEELDTITLNKFSNNGKETHRGRNDQYYRERRERGYGAQVNRAQFNNPTQNRRQGNNFHNRGKQQQKRS